jgi:hypothetical protein
LRYAGREQHQIRKATAVEWEIGDGAFVKKSGDGGGLSVNQRGSATDGDMFLSPGYGETELDLGGSAYVYVELRCDLR